jgi:hypothetical protein
MLFPFPGLTSPSYDDLFDYEQRSISAVNGGAIANDLIVGSYGNSMNNNTNGGGYYDQTNLNSPPTTSSTSASNASGGDYHTQFVFGGGIHGLYDDDMNHHRQGVQNTGGGILVFDNTDRGTLAWRYRSGISEMPT